MTDRRISRRSFLRLAGAGGVLAVLSSCAVTRPRAVAGIVVKTYRESADYFPNPERGWHVSIDPAFWNDTTMPHDPAQPWLENQKFTPEKLREHRAAGITLVRKYYHLYPYRESDIPESYLDEHPRYDFDLVREAGFKLIPRFIYTWNLDIDGGEEANLEWMMRHLDQLAPILRANADVISHMEMGLVGLGGEWHTSGGGYIADSWKNPSTGVAYGYGLNEKSMAVIDKVLEVLPKKRMALMRAIPFVQQYLHETGGDADPPIEQDAYGGADKARLGFHDDAFLYDATHRGTYWPSESPEGEEIRTAERYYQEQVTRYAVMSGEPSAVDSRGYAFKSDPLVELATMHWRSMNNGQDEAVRDGLYDFWKDRGAYDEIGMRLGYRFSLLSASVQSSIGLGGTFGLAFTIKNSGFGAPHNERLVEVVLRHVGTGEEYYLRLGEDPRRWWPGQILAVHAIGRVPDGIRPGGYDVFLNFPDPDLPGRPEYSIRLANDGVWEEYSGYNSLGVKTEVAEKTIPFVVALPLFEKRPSPPKDDRRTAITIPASTPEAEAAPSPELVEEENDVLVDFKDRPDTDDAPITGEYAGIDWGESGTWRTARDGYGKYLFLNSGQREARATFRLPEGKVLKSFMLLKYERGAAVDKITLHSGEKEYVWDNPAPWWAHHVLVEDWQDASEEVAVTVESDSKWFSANLGIDNIVYGDPSPPVEVTFEDLPAGTLLTGSYGGIEWGGEEIWRVGELDGYGKFAYVDESLLPEGERRDRKAYFTLSDEMVLKSVEVRKREGETTNGDRILFTAVPPERDNPEGHEYDFETASSIPATGWQPVVFAYAKPWGKVGVRVQSEGATDRDIGNVLIGSITYRREVRLAGSLRSGSLRSR